MPSKKRLSHVDARGRVTMVDVGDKPVTSREAIARGSIRMSREALSQIRRGAVQKGDPLQAVHRDSSLEASGLGAPVRWTTSCWSDTGSIVMPSDSARVRVEGSSGPRTVTRT